jgi:transposase
MSVEAAGSQARVGALILAVVVLTATLVLAALSRAQASPVPGGTVPSTLSLSLGEPSSFKRLGASGSGSGIYVSVIKAEVTATDTPVRLSLVDGEATHGRRLGHLAAGSSVLSPALRAQASGGAYRPLDASFPPELKTWGQPVTATPTKIRLRQEARNAGVLRNHHKLLLVTLTAGAP